MEIFIIIIGFFIILGLAGLGFLIWKIMNTKPNDEETKKILEEFARDREDRFRESEALKSELRETSKTLRDEFFKVNKTVDSKLSESSKQLNERLDKSSHVIGNLQKELGKMGEIGAKIEHLDKILRAPKGRGNMGEESLEEILRSVFPANLWVRQFPIERVGIVDAAVKTSNGIIPIDSKFPLPAFEKIVNAEDDPTREAAQKEFAKDCKKRIDEVSKYIRPEAGTLNFAILFLPNENIYYEAAIRSGIVSDYAREKKVLLTGPNTMLYVLQMLFQAYQSQEFAKEAQKALAQLAGVKTQAGKLDEAISILGKHIGNANAKIGDVQTENQKLQNQIEKVANLEGASNKEGESQTTLL